MSGQTLMIAFHGALVIFLLTSVVGDLKHRTIPNWLTAGVAILALLYWPLAGAPIWPDIALQAALAALVFAAFVVAFYFRAMGGGDVKLIGALSLWFPLLELMRFLLIMAMLGGLLTFAFWVHHKVTKSSQTLEIPYGVAIAAAGLWAVYERYLNHFA